MSVPFSQRLQKRRDALRAAGLREIRIWLPDRRRPGFADECRRQARVAAAPDAIDPGLDAFTDVIFADQVPERER